MEQFMSKSEFWSLFRLTLTNPREAGKRVIAKDFPQQGLWIALALVSVLLSLMVSGLTQLMPLPADTQGDLMKLSPAYHSPLIFALFQWGQSVITVFVLHWVGLIFRGKGRMTEMLTVMIWLQVVSLILAAILFLISLIAPPLGAFLLLLAVFWGLWATISLIDAAHRFDNMFMALLVFGASVVALAIGISVLLGLVGLTAAGMI